MDHGHHGLATDHPAPIHRQREVEVYSNRFGTLYDDEVLSPSGGTGRYLRWRWATEGVVVIPVAAEGVALVPMYRYPVGRPSLELPRGGCEAGEAPAVSAARELREETGLSCPPQTLRRLGVLHPDTGLIETDVHVYLAPVSGGPDSGAATPERMESLGRTVWLAPGRLRDLLCEGAITCGVTLAALTLAMADGAVRA